MKKLFSVQRPFGLGKFNQAPHYTFCRLQDGGLAILRVHDSDIIISDAHFHELSSFSFRESRDQAGRSLAAINETSPILRTHCIAQGSDGPLLVYDPVSNDILTLNLSGKQIGRFKLPFRARAIQPIGKNDLLVAGVYKDSLLHLFNRIGEYLKPLTPPDARLDPEGDPFSNGKLLTAQDSTYGFIFDQAAGIAEFRDHPSGVVHKTVITKDRELSPVSQWSAGFGKDKWFLQIQWPSMPLGMATIGTDDRGNWIFLSGSGRDFAIMSAHDSGAQFRRFPRIGSDVEQPVYMEATADHIAIGTNTGAIWLVSGSEIQSISHEQYAAAINKKYVSFGGLSLGSGTGFVVSDEDIQKQKAVWKSFVGSCEFTAHINSDGHVESIAPVQTSQDQASNAYLLLDVLKNSRFMTEGESFGANGIDLKILVSVSSWAVDFAERPGTQQF